MVLVIATPSLMLPGIGADTRQIVALAALCAGVLTFVEYASTYPGLVEFRDAAPFNRIRFVSLFLTLFLLSALMASGSTPSTLSLFVRVTGMAVAQSIDLPYSPVRLLTMMLAADTPPAQVELVRTAGGLAYIISLITLAYFVLILRTLGWPNRATSFNVWVNLPTFDPTAGGDIVSRLRRDARFNIGLGCLLPFVIPAMVYSASSLFDPVTLTSPHTLIWTVTAWAFLPVSLFMRGIAMGRIATMIEQTRQSNQRMATAQLAAA
ncbi:hypothetical protein [Phaeovulum veldkampii]|uniref:hypothetical protein n=1 Tax=Phaeovulum veldkampii TaxID=33049 RepID=UPI002E2699DA